MEVKSRTQEVSTAGIPAACTAVCAPYVDGDADAVADVLRGPAAGHDDAPMSLDVQLPQVLPTDISFPPGTKPGDVIMRLVQQSGGPPVSSQTLLSLVTTALASVAGPIACVSVPNAQYASLWQSVSVVNTTFIGCTPNIDQIVRNAAKGPVAAPPTMQCTVPNSDATTPAARAQLASAVSQALRSPVVLPILPMDALIKYMVSVMTDALESSGGTGARLCAQNAMLTNSVNLNDALFAYPGFAQCAQCIRTGTASGAMPVCLDIKQTLAHPLVQCLSRGLTFVQTPASGGGGGSGGGGSNPTPPAKTPSHTRTIAIAVGAAFACIVLLAVIIVSVRAVRRGSRHGNASVPAG